VGASGPALMLDVVCSARLPPLPPPETPHQHLSILLLTIKNTQLFATHKNQTAHMWADLLQRHSQMQYHLQVGGGDQVGANRTVQPRCFGMQAPPPHPSPSLPVSLSNGFQLITMNAAVSKHPQPHRPTPNPLNPKPQIYCDDVWSLPSVLQVGASYIKHQLPRHAHREAFIATSPNKHPQTIPKPHPNPTPTPSGLQ